MARPPIKALLTRCFDCRLRQHTEAVERPEFSFAVVAVHGNAQSHFRCYGRRRPPAFLSPRFFAPDGDVHGNAAFDKSPRMSSSGAVYCGKRQCPACFLAAQGNIRRVKKKNSGKDISKRYMINDDAHNQALRVDMSDKNHALRAPVFGKDDYGGQIRVLEAYFEGGGIPPTHKRLH